MSDDNGWAPACPEDTDWATPTGKLLSEPIHEVLGDNPPVPVETKVVEGHAAAVLPDESADADLVVGSRRGGGFSGLPLGSVSQHCVRHGRCPVVVLPPPNARLSTADRSATVA